eukprot:scaffold5475_cov127-Isochrysis_galbana.AAC.6
MAKAKTARKTNRQPEDAKLLQPVPAEDTSRANHASKAARRQGGKAARRQGGKAARQGGGVSPRVARFWVDGLAVLPLPLRFA